MPATVGSVSVSIADHNASPTDLPFGARLRAAMDTHGPLCAGIDPHAGLLQAWGLPDDVDGLARFAQVCVEAFGGAVACVKPQSAFFERFGSAGIAVLERTLAGLAEAGTLQRRQHAMYKGGRSY